MIDILLFSLQAVSSQYVSEIRVYNTASFTHTHILYAPLDKDTLSTAWALNIGIAVQYIAVPNIFGSTTCKNIVICILWNSTNVGPESRNQHTSSNS